jgi:hypothetical protein
MDRRGLMIRVGKRVVSACCSCGSMAEIWQKSCLQYGEPLCHTCIENKLLNQGHQSNAVGNFLQSGDKIKQNHTEMCYLCGKFDKSTQKTKSAIKVIAFNDVKGNELPYYRLVKIIVCQWHAKLYTVFKGARIKCPVQITSMKAATSDNARCVGTGGSSFTVDAHTDNLVRIQKKQASTRSSFYHQRRVFTSNTSSSRKRDKKFVNKKDAEATVKMKAMKRKAIAVASGTAKRKKLNTSEHRPHGGTDI